jgi:hypothetical protein
VGHSAKVTTWKRSRKNPGPSSALKVSVLAHPYHKLSDLSAATIFIRLAHDLVNSGF